MTAADLRATLVGFATAAVILAVLYWLVGAGKVIATVARADLGLVAAVALLMVGWMVAWGITLRVVVGVIGVETGVVESVLVYGAAVFANNVTPLGQAGGEPISAALIADSTETDYETGLAAIASVDALNFVPSMSLALAGLGYYALTVGFGRLPAWLATGVVGVAVTAIVAAIVGWHYRYRLENRTVQVLTPAFRSVARVIPRVNPPDPQKLRESVESFFHSVERVATNRRGFLAALLFSTVGWLCQALALWVAFLALDVHIPIYIPLFVIPLGATASVVPTPGGLGGIEAVNILLLTLATGVGTPVVTGAVTIHRIGGYLFMTTLGGGAAAFLRTR